MLFPNTPMLQQICQSAASGASPAAIRRKFFMLILFFRNYYLYYEREFKLDLTYENVRYNTDHSRIDLPAFPFCGSCHRLSRSRPVGAIRHYGRFLDQRNLSGPDQGICKQMLCRHYNYELLLCSSLRRSRLRHGSPAQGRQYLVWRRHGRDEVVQRKQPPAPRMQFSPSPPCRSVGRKCSRPAFRKIFLARERQTRMQGSYGTRQGSLPQGRAVSRA